MKYDKFPEKEVWNLDHTIACFIVPRLKALKKGQYGHPCDLTEKEWDDTLDKIIDGFELVMYKDENFTLAWDYFHVHIPDNFIDMLNDDKYYDDGMQQLHIYEYMCDCMIQEAVDLFAKYYRNLWD